MTLEQLARERGVYWSDKTTPCTSKPPVASPAVNATLEAAHAAASVVANVTSEAANSAASMVANAASMASNSTMRLFARESATRDQDQCVVTIMGIEVTTSSFAMYTFSFAVLVQAVALVSFSAVADHGQLSNPLRMVFADDLRQLQEKALARIRLHRSHIIYAVSLCCARDILRSPHTGHRRSDLSRFVLRCAQLLLTTSRWQPPRSPRRRNAPFFINSHGRSQTQRF